MRISDCAWFPSRANVTVRCRGKHSRSRQPARNEGCRSTIGYGAGESSQTRQASAMRQGCMKKRRPVVTGPPSWIEAAAKLMLLRLHQPRDVEPLEQRRTALEIIERETLETEQCAPIAEVRAEEVVIRRRLALDRLQHIDERDLARRVALDGRRRDVAREREIVLHVARALCVFAEIAHFIAHVRIDLGIRLLDLQILPGEAVLFGLDAVAALTPVPQRDVTVE